MMSRKSPKGLRAGLLLRGLLFGCFVAGGLFVVGNAHAQDAAKNVDAVVKFRKSLMQETQASLQAISLLLKGEVADEASLALQAQILALATERAGEAFVLRTRGFVERTTAHERVWTEQKKFQALMKKFASDTKALSQLAARTASAQELGSAFGDLAKQCKSCHQRYRIKDK